MTHVRASMLHRLVGACAAVIVGLTSVVVVASPAAAEGTILGMDNRNGMAGSYLVVYEESAAWAQGLTASLADRYDAAVTHVYSKAVHGFAARMSENAARHLAAEPAIAFVEQDAVVFAAATQSPTPSWGLDRIDQASTPLDGAYTYPTTASGVTAYIIDTGIRTTHSDFGGRALWGINTVDSTNSDCNGHGTHQAGTVGGTSFGVAKGVRLVAVKVLDCTGAGTVSGTVAGVDWVTGNHTSGPAVANRSLSSSGTSATLENAVRVSIADGVVYTVPSGNTNADACNSTPARVAEAITVNASDINDNRPAFSNFGTCTDMFAPGVNVTSAWGTSNTATNTSSGTSTAAAHVAGAAALILGESPNLTPAEVANEIYADATPNKIINPGGGSPNRLLLVVGSPIKNNVEFWNNVLLETFRRQGGGPGPLARAAAVMHAGLFDAVNSATLSRRGSTPYNSYLTLQVVDKSVNQNLVAGFVARDLLIAALPQQRGYIEQKFTERYGTSSQTVARQLADAVVGALLTARANDGADDPTGYTPQNLAGAWRPTDGCSVVNPAWGNVRPFTLTSASQFRRPPPATDYPTLLASSTYSSNLADVRSLGRDTSTTRTADQTQAAWFWANDLDGTYKPPGHLLAITATVTAGRPTDGLQVSRLFALVSLAMADAGIAAWDMKFLTPFDLWRPETAIQQDPVSPDPTWEPLSANRNNVSFSPCFPAWVSGHATFAAAWAGIMRNELGDNVSFTATTEDPHATGVTRTFTSFTAAATENARSRIYLGVHYQFDADDGMTTGFNIANHLTNNYLRPRT